MLTIDQINELHHLYWVERWAIRKIERHLRMGWRTIRKYLDSPTQTSAPRARTSKLDPFKPTISELLEKDPRVRAKLRLLYAIAAVAEPGCSVVCGDGWEDFGEGGF